MRNNPLSFAINGKVVDLEIMIKAILLDVDNTLLDFDAYCLEGIKKGFEIFNLPPFEDHFYDVFFEINTKLWQDLEKGTITREELFATRWKIIFERLGIGFDGPTFEKFFRAQLFDSAILIDGAIDILDYLKGKYVLCIATNGTYKQQMNRLTRGGLIHYFDHFFISEKIGEPKPSNLFFDYCFKELNENSNGNNVVNKDEVLVIGDSISSDISGAIKYGFKTCLFDRHKNIDQKSFAIDYVVNDLREIVNIL